MSIKDFKKCYISNDGMMYCYDSEIKRWVIVTVSVADKLPYDILQKITEQALLNEKDISEAI